MNNKNKLTVEKSDFSHNINENDTVYRTDLGKYSKVTFVANPSKTVGIRKVNKFEYLDLGTGEIKRYNLDNPTSKSDVNRKLRKYEEMVIYNFTGGATDLFITLTCNKPVTDIADIKQYYNKFIDNLKKDYQDIDYVALFEQTESWCWHIHLFIKNNQHKKLFIPHHKLLEYWGQGAVYMMQNTNTFQTLGHSKDKRDDRLERFRHFPKGEKMYHKSKGIKIPQREKMTYKDCPEYNSVNHTKVSSKTYHIRNTTNDKIVNTIATEMYKQVSATTDKQIPVESQNQETKSNDNETSVSGQAPPVDKKSKVQQMIERQNSPGNKMYWEFI